MSAASGGKRPSAFQERGRFHPDTDTKEEFNVPESFFPGQKILFSKRLPLASTSANLASILASYSDANATRTGRRHSRCRFDVPSKVSPRLLLRRPRSVISDGSVAPGKVAPQF